MGEVSSNEDSGHADAALNCPEPHPKHCPQHPVRDRWPCQCQGQFALPMALPSPIPNNFWLAAELVLMQTLPGVPQPSCQSTALCLDGLGCASHCWSCVCLARVVLAHSLPVSECPRLLLSLSSREEGRHHDVVHTCCTHGMARWAPWARRETQVRLCMSQSRAQAGVCAEPPQLHQGSRSAPCRGCPASFHCRHRRRPQEHSSSGPLSRAVQGHVPPAGCQPQP